MVDHRKENLIETDDDSVAEIDHDAMCKELLKDFYKEFIELFFFGLSKRIDWDDAVNAGTETIRKFSSKKKRKRKFSDLTIRVKCRDTGLPVLLHIEVQEQTKDLKNFPQRMFIYVSRLIEEHDFPVYPIALLTFDKPATEQARSFELECLGKEVVSFHYEVVQLNRLNGMNYADTLNPVAVALAAKMHIAKEDRPVVKLKCLSTLQQLQITEKGKENIADFIKIYLKLEPSEEIVFETLLERAKNKDEVIEMVSTWRGEGRLEEAIALVNRQLTKRFGSLPSSIPEQISTMTVAQIEQLAEDLLDFDSLNDLVKWMANNKKSN